MSEHRLSFESLDEKIQEQEYILLKNNDDRQSYMFEKNLFYRSKNSSLYTKNQNLKTSLINNVIFKN